jgi:hypothetical protein
MSDIREWAATTIINYVDTGNSNTASGILTASEDGQAVWLDPTWYWNTWWPAWYSIPREHVRLDGSRIETAFRIAKKLLGVGLIENGCDEVITVEDFVALVEIIAKEL